MSRFSGILLGLLMTPTAVFAETTNSISLSRVLWNERLQVAQGSVTDRGTASYVGDMLAYDRSWNQGSWTTAVTAELGFGRASSGGFDGTTSFSDTGDRRFLLVGVVPRGFYRLTDQIRLGAALPIIHRNISWGSSNAAISVQPRRSWAVMATGGLQVDLTPRWGFSQEMGLLSFDSETFWRFGVHYSL